MDAYDAAALVLHLSSVARQVCPSAGGDQLEKTNGVSRFLEILRKYFALEAANSIRQGVVRFRQFRRTDQTIDEYIAENDL